MMIMAPSNKAMADAKFFESYSRYIESEDRYESWPEAVRRVMDMHRHKFADKMTDKLDSIFHFIEGRYVDKHILGAQRALQFGGEQLLKHEMKMYNCTSTYADRPDFFYQAMYMLLCGSGVGFSVQKHHVARLPQVSRPVGDKITYLVPDSIEGWSHAIGITLSSYFKHSGSHPDFQGKQVEFDYSAIRSKGSPISGGFKAPGPKPLFDAITKIKALLDKATANGTCHLRPIQVYDIVMFFADAVISGGVRRAATLCMFSHDDLEMTNAKTGNWFAENPQRSRSNNSAILVRDTVTREDFLELLDATRQFGDPGFIFTNSTEFTYNPCVEIGMLPVTSEGVSGIQGCNLTEVNGSIKTEDEFYAACRAASYLGTLQAGYTNFPFLGKATEEIFKKEALIGVSITGWMNNPDMLFNEDVMRKGARIIKEANREMAALIGINPAARTTCVKPSGNASVLLGTSSGIHGEHAKQYIRNVQMNANAEVAQIIQKINPDMVQPNFSKLGDVVISFPIITPEGAMLKSDLMGIKHLEYVKKCQQVWVEEGTNVELCADPSLRHNVSNTILVDDWSEVGNYLYDNRAHFAGVSMLSSFGDKDFSQAPFTTVPDQEEMQQAYGDIDESVQQRAMGLIAQGEKAFGGDLWSACTRALYLDNVHAVAKTLMGDRFMERNQWQWALLEELKKTEGANVAEEILGEEWRKQIPGKEQFEFINGLEALQRLMGHREMVTTTYYLKDLYNRRRWETIVSNTQDIDWVAKLKRKELVDVDTLGAAACSGGACEFNF